MASAKDFAPNDPLLCGTCGEKEATHEISIRVQRGTDYQQTNQLYVVTYAVCGVCAREVVTVKLGASLAGARKR